MVPPPSGPASRSAWSQNQPPGERYRPVSGWAHTMTLIALVSQPRSNLLRLQLPDTSDGTTAVFKTPMYYRCQITSGQLQKNFAKSVTKFMSMTLRHYLPQTIGMKRNWKWFACNTKKVFTAGFGEEEKKEALLTCLYEQDSWNCLSVRYNSILSR